MSNWPVKQGVMEAGRRMAARLKARTVLRKRYSFSVSLLLDELDNVPRVTGWIFCKVRLLDGSFTQESQRQEVLHNSVQWGKMFEFECQTTVNSSTGVLDNCTCRLSVRRDIKGGKSYKKVGYVDLNLSEFAGSGYVTRHCLLEEYTSMSKNNKLDNSILKVGLQMQLLKGDPCFRVPTLQSDISIGTTSSENCDTLRKSISNYFDRGMSVDSLRSQMEIIKGGLLDDTSPSQNAEALERARVAGQLTRVGHTRVDAQDVVENLCRESFSASDLPHTMEDAELALYVGHDGTTSLGVAHRSNRDLCARNLENVIIMK